MKKIKVFYGRQPILEVRTETSPGPNLGNEYGMSRDRKPDAGWGQITGTIMDKAVEVDLTPELKQTLLEDIAYVYGQDSSKFTEKLKEFELLTPSKDELREVFGDARGESYGEMYYFDFDCWFNRKN